MSEKSSSNEHNSQSISAEQQSTENPVSGPGQLNSNSSLSGAVRTAVDNYLHAMEGQEVRDLYDLLLSEIEAPLLASVMTSTNQNQSSASTMLGLNRGTLRKKLKKYGLV